MLAFAATPKAWPVAAHSTPSASLPAASPTATWRRTHTWTNHQALAVVATAAGARLQARSRKTRLQATRDSSLATVKATSPGSFASAELGTASRPLEVPEEIKDIAEAGADTKTPHWADAPKWEVRTSKVRPIEKMVWKDLHGKACIASGVLFLFELARFIAGEPPSDTECYVAGIIYALIYASRFDGIKKLAPHFRVTFYATTGWTIYYIAHLLAATNPAVFAHGVYPAGIIMLASTIYFYKHWLERMWRHFVEDRFRPYYMPGLLGLMYFHTLDLVDMFNQWFDPQYWDHVPLLLPDQAWTIQDVRLTGLFMSSMALFMITLHNKGVLTGAGNTLITVLFTIFVPAFVLTGTHMNLSASFP